MQHYAQAKMDRELAGVVIDNWEAGEPITETQLYKAAEALDIDPMAALVEARFYTYLDKCLLEKRAMSRGERIVFSAAAGLNDRAMIKSASAFGLSPDELIIEALRERGFTPDVESICKLASVDDFAFPILDKAHAAYKGVKSTINNPNVRHRAGQAAKGVRAAGYTGGAIYAGKSVFGGKDKEANLAPPMMGMDPSQSGAGPGGGGKKPQQPGMPQDPMQAGPPVPPEQEAGDIMMAPPDPNAMLQQQPSARVKPSPTAPDQIAASPVGNLDELVQQGQQVFGDQAMDNGGAAPQGMPEPAPPPPSPEDRIRQVGPNLDDETVARYADQLQRFEEGFQMPINDPKQMVKFVKELQKVDGKKVDQGIKAMGQQLEQEQAQELGVDSTPTIDGPGGAMGGGPGTKMAPKPEAQGQPMPEQQAGPMSGSQQGAADTQSGEGGQGGSAQSPTKPGGPPRPQPKSAPPQQTAEAAVEKVANAARALARAAFF